MRSSRIPQSSLGFAVGVVLLLGSLVSIGLARAISQSGEPGPVPKLQQVDSKQCAAARDMAGAAITHARDQFSAAAARGALTGFEREYDAAMEWINAGCPPDPVRGFIPDSSGRGGEIRIFSNQAFSFDGTGSHTGLPLIPLPD